jgi:hypothetical protein
MHRDSNEDHSTLTAWLIVENLLTGSHHKGGRLTSRRTVASRSGPRWPSCTAPILPRTAKLRRAALRHGNADAYLYGRRMQKAATR